MARIPHAVPTNAAREEAILSLLPLVNKIAKFLSFKTRKELGDLLGDGYLGAIYAVDRFDPTRGTKLSTYAVPVIYGHIMRGINDRDPWPEKLAQTLRRADQAIVALDAHLGRPATEAEIEDVVPGYRKARAKARMWSMASIDATAQAGIDVARSDESPSANIEAQDEGRYLREQIAQLAPRMREAITGHYFEKKSLLQIAREQQVSGQAAQQAHTRAITRLREMIAPAYH